MRGFDSYFYTAEISRSLTFNSNLDPLPRPTDIVDGLLSTIPDQNTGNTPVITLIRPTPANTQISIYEDQMTNVRFSIAADNPIYSVDLYRESTLEQSLRPEEGQKDFAIAINEAQNMEPATYVYTIEVIDTK